MIPAPEPGAGAISAGVFRREVRRWSRRIGVEVQEIRIRSMTRKLASASSAGRLTFDSSLLGAPPERRAEVVVHELVHLRVGNHGPLFRNLVRAYLADVPEGRKGSGPQAAGKHRRRPPGAISTAYDIEAHPNVDVFDPVAWFEGTGEDLGLPPGYMDQYNRAMAESAARRAAAEKVDVHTEDGQVHPSSGSGGDDPARVPSDPQPRKRHA
jgi:hypothetical protein